VVPQKRSGSHALSTSGQNDSLFLGEGLPGKAMKKIVIVAAALAVLATPAMAQRRGQQAQPPSAEEISKKQQAQALDQQYKATLKRMNKDGATTRTDPWSNMRDTSDATKK
jgi:hypothetical protein